MGKATGFLEYQRKQADTEAVKTNTTFWRVPDISCTGKQQKQGGRCMECGVPFCQSGEMLAGMVSGCPLHNLVPETNDLVWRGNWKQAYERLTATHCSGVHQAEFVRLFARQPVPAA